MVEQKTKRKRLPKLNWREIAPSKSGCRRWQTLDGLFQLVCQDQYQGIKLPTRWQLWQFKHGDFRKVEELRNHAAIEKAARVRMAAIEESENDE